MGAKDGQSRKWIGSEVLDIWIDGEERQVVDGNADSVVVIDTSPIGTVDFGLEPLEKEFLLKIGRAAALRCLLRLKLDDGPDEATVDAAEGEAEAYRTAVLALRKRRRWRRSCVALVVIADVWILLPRVWNVISAWDGLRRIL